MPAVWISLTSEEGDFRLGKVTTAASLLTTGPPLLAVVKKNSRVLRRLLKWLDAAPPEIRAACPTLVIDDEADQASVNTGSGDTDRPAVNKAILEAASPGATGGLRRLHGNALCERLHRPDDPRRPLPARLHRRPAAPARLLRRSAADSAATASARTRTTTPSTASTWSAASPTATSSGSSPLGRPRTASSRPCPTPSSTRLTTSSSRRRREPPAVRRTSTAPCSCTRPFFSRVHVKTKPLVAKHLADRLAGCPRRRTRMILARFAETRKRERDAVPPEATGEAPTSFEAMAGPAGARALSDAEVVVENSISDFRLDYETSEHRVHVIIGGNVLSRGLTPRRPRGQLLRPHGVDRSTPCSRWAAGSATARPDSRTCPAVWMTQELVGRLPRPRLGREGAPPRPPALRARRGVTPLDFAPKIRTHPTLMITSELRRCSGPSRRRRVLLEPLRARRRLSTGPRRTRSLVRTNVPRRGRSLSATADREEAWRAVAAAGGSATASLWSAIRRPSWTPTRHPPATTSRPVPLCIRDYVRATGCRRVLALPSLGRRRSSAVRPGAGSFGIGNGLEIGPAEALTDSLGRTRSIGLSRRVITSDAGLLLRPPRRRCRGRRSDDPGRRRAPGTTLGTPAAASTASTRTPNPEAAKTEGHVRRLHRHRARSATPSAPPSSSPRAASLTPQALQDGRPVRRPDREETRAADRRGGRGGPGMSPARSSGPAWGALGLVKAAVGLTSCGRRETEAPSRWAAASPFAALDWQGHRHLLVPMAEGPNRPRRSDREEPGST